jgi:hypothetical protein
MFLYEEGHGFWIFPTKEMILILNRGAVLVVLSKAHRPHGPGRNHLIALLFLYFIFLRLVILSTIFLVKSRERWSWIFWSYNCILSWNFKKSYIYYSSWRWKKVKTVKKRKENVAHMSSKVFVKYVFWKKNFWWRCWFSSWRRVCFSEMIVDAATLGTLKILSERENQVFVSDR